MADIIDIVAQLSYNVEDAELQQAATALNTQILQIQKLGIENAKLERQLKKAGADDLALRQKINAQIAANNKQVQQLTASIGQQVQQNAKLQQAITKEIGLINTLRLQMKALEEARDKAFDEREIEGFNRQIGQIQARIGGLTRTSAGGAGRGIFSTILQGVGIGTGIGLVTQGLSALQSFVSEGVRLANETEGVQRAFDRLNDPNLLTNLRTSVSGTVSDLELMKQAVQFNNFGLPVERLGIALAFARERAQDTGQSIDFLVQSIVTGIGRQSPLILDNLGINAKRVSDRFKQTGDFAKAAFEIIAEESAKAGNSLDTFADKQAQLNARIANLQAEVGKSFQQSGLLIQSFLADFVTEGNFTLTRQAIDFIKEQDRLQKEALNQQVNTLERYYSQYEKADASGRQAILRSATSSYSDILSEQKRFESLGLQSTVDVLRKQAEAYRTFFNRIGGVSTGNNVTFSNFTSQSLLGLTEEELQGLREQGLNARRPLTAGDPQVDAVNNRIREIDKALERFSQKVKTTRQKVRQETVRTRDLIELSPEEWERQIDKLEKDINDFRNRVSRNADSLGRAGVTSGPSGIDSATPSGDIMDQIQIARNAREREEQEEKRRAETINTRNEAIKSSFTDIASVAINAYQTIYDARLRLLDLEIEAQRDRQAVAVSLAERGNTQILEQESQRLQALQREREQLAQRQIQVNAVLQASNAAVATTEAIGAVVKAAAAGDPYTVAARVAAAVAALVGGIIAIRNAFGSGRGFADGGYTGDGNKYQEAGVVHKGEFVMTKEKTAKYREVLEQMHAGTYKLPNSYNSTTTNVTRVEMKGVERKLDALINATESNKFKQDVRVDERGVTIMTQKEAKREQLRWS